jgi:putative SOS response-associated peptidase YedK
MCGRYVSPDDAVIEREFNLIHSPGLKVRASYNVAPTQTRQAEGGRALELLRWGLIPLFARGVPPKYSAINARIEIVQTAASHRGCNPQKLRHVQAGARKYS